MKTTLILLACMLAGGAMRAGEQSPVSAKMEIAKAPEGQRTLYETQLGKAVRAVNAWWAEHSAGFRDYPMRMPHTGWTTLGPSFSSDPDIIGFSEDGAHKDETLWFASTSRTRQGSWKVSFPTGLKYSFEWRVDVTGDKPEVIEVRITSPVI